MKMTFKKRKNRSILIFFIVNVSIFVSIFLIVIPIIEKIYDKKDLLEEKRVSLRENFNEMDRYKEDLSYLDKKQYLIENLEIDKENRILLIKSLEKISDEEQMELEIKDETKSKSVSKNKSSEIILGLSLAGDYDDLLNFIYKLQNFKYSMQIESVSVESFDKKKVKREAETEQIIFPEISSEIIISFKE